MSKPSLSLKEICLGFGNRELFNDLDLHIYEHDKVALVGKNGEGKSTLLKLLNKEVEQDKGDFWHLPTLKIAYLPQQFDEDLQQTVGKYVESEKEFEVEQVLQAIGLKPEWELNNLSGGQLRKAMIAKCLLQNAGLILLDEPTNHLDIATIEWLESWINKYRGALICISHDRQFLRNISNKTFWIDRGKVRVNDAGYAAFDEWSAILIEQERRELEKLSKKLAEEEVWKIQGVTARRKRNQKRLKDLYSLRDRIRHGRNAINKFNAKIKLDPLAPTLSSKMVVEFNEVSKSFGETKILEGFSLRIMRGDRIGVIGANGTGKSTFLKLLTQELLPDAGRIKMGKNIEITYYDQARTELDPEETLWKTMCPGGGDHVRVGEKQIHVCAYLKNFMFDPKSAVDRVSTLSGGQRNRLLLARTLANPGSVLIMDEPSNDLDVDTLDMIVDILGDYSGTLILVSHDRDFMDKLVTQSIIFNGNADIEECIGSYFDYRKNKLEAQKPQKRAAKKAEELPKESDKISYKIKREMELLPGQIAEAEAEIVKLEDALADPNLFMDNPAQFKSFSDKLNEMNELYEQLLNRWFELN
ncbi:MAG: ABC-F family ATP-binding cassette domain-containing protein [Rickettsiales bacterium]